MFTKYIQVTAKFRFAIAFPVVSLNPLSKSITSILKLIFKQIESYNDKCRVFFRNRYFLRLFLTNEPVINKIKLLNKRNKADTITTFCISTLYMKIPNNKLLKVMYDLTDFYFDGADNVYVAVTKYGAK